MYIVLNYTIGVYKVNPGKRSSCSIE